MTTVRCTVCGTEHEIGVGKDAYGTANGAITETWRTPGSEDWVQEEPSCHYEVAAPFEVERSMRRTKTVPRSPTYASLSSTRLAVAEVWAETPDGKLRKVTVCVNPQALLDWAISHLPYEAKLFTETSTRGVWVEQELRT